MITFKKYILLQEYTKEIMPEIYAALEKYDDPMVGVHFSKGVPKGRDRKVKVPHLGINPRPFHNDPIGIYAFPKDYVLSGGLERNTGFEVNPYYYIVKPSSKANILNLSRMSDSDARDILIKMGIDNPNGESYMDDPKIFHHSKGELKAGHKFWGVLEVVRKKLKNAGKNSSWNVLFKDSGYNVLYDEGDAIIHSNEPSQIIYLESSAMEVLDQGKQDDSSNKIYSFFIKQFPELRPEKTKTHWGERAFILYSNEGYKLKIIPDFEERRGYDKIKLEIISDDLRNVEKFDIYLSNLFTPSEYFPDQYIVINQIKNKIEEMQKEGRISNSEKKEDEPPNILKSISERFNIKLKKDERGDWEIRQKYQDRDKDYVITFYIRTHNDDIIFVLNKKQKSINYNTFGYNEAALIKYRERYTPEEIVDMGLKELEFKRYGSVSVNHDAMKTIEFLRKKVFRL